MKTQRAAIKAISDPINPETDALDPASSQLLELNLRLELATDATLMMTEGKLVGIPDVITRLPTLPPSMRMKSSSSISGCVNRYQRSCASRAHARSSDPVPSVPSTCAVNHHES